MARPVCCGHCHLPCAGGLPLDAAAGKGAPPCCMGAQHGVHAPCISSQRGPHGSPSGLPAMVHQPPDCVPATQSSARRLLMFKDNIIHVPAAGEQGVVGRAERCCGGLAPQRGASCAACSACCPAGPAGSLCISAAPGAAILRTTCQVCGWEAWGVVSSHGYPCTSPHRPCIAFRVQLRAPSRQHYAVLLRHYWPRLLVTSTAWLLNDFAVSARRVFTWPVGSLRGACCWQAMGGLEH